MKKIALYSLAVLALFACQREADFQVKEVLPTYTVTIQAGLNADTKTSYTQDGKFSWAAGDKIGVVAVKGEEMLQATGETQDAKPIATFNVDVPEGYTLGAMASYPYYSPEAKIVNDLRYDAAKKGWALSADTQPDLVNPLASVPLIGTQDINGYYQFVTATGIVKFTVENVPSATEFVELKGVEGAALAGVFDTNDKGVLTMEKAIDATPAIRNHNSPKGEKNTTMDFYFFVPEGSLAEGTELRFCNAEGAVKAFPFKSAVAVTANKIVKIDTLTVDPEPIYNRQTDSLALVAIYNAADGANWKEERRWDLSKPISGWDGVTVENDRVTKLQITASGVIASEWIMPKEIGNLTCLTILKINQNKLKGELPDELYDLSNLTDLWLQNNNITGALSPKLGQLTNLAQLYLDRNANMTGGIPKEIGQLKKLARINISQSGIGGEIPAELGGCESLLQLMAYKTGLSGELPDIWDMPVLQTVQLHSNPGLTGNLPSSLGKLKPLASGAAPSLQLYGCSFTGNIPASFAGLPDKTAQVQVQGNKMSGRIPVACQNHASFGKWKYSPQQDGYELWTEDRRQADSLILMKFYAIADGANWKESRRWDLSKSIDKWPGIKLNEGERVIELSITNGTVTTVEWSIPEEIIGLTELQTFQAVGSKVVGDFPEFLCDLPKLASLRLNTNAKLTGSLPAKIANLQALTDLYINGTGITGGLPKEIGQLKKLKNINIADSKMGGEIPAELTGCTALVNFMAYNCGLTGEVPDFWDQFENVGIIQLYKNPGLTGSLPASCGRATTTATNYSLRFDDCNFTGNIPESYATLPAQCKQFFAKGNQLSGVVPAGVQAHANWTKWNAAVNILPQQEGYGLTLE